MEQQQSESEMELSVESTAVPEAGKLSVEISNESSVETRTNPSVETRMEQQQSESEMELSVDSKAEPSACSGNIYHC